MAITLIAVIVALALGHVAQPLAASVRQYGWYESWLRWLDTQFAQEHGFWRGRYGIALALLPPLLAVALFQFALQTPLAGVVGLLFAIAVLFYAWGPRDLDLDVDAVVDARDPAARRDAAARLWPEYEPTPGTRANASLDGAALVGAVFDSALRRWFGVLFWFLLLGPFGALLYRLTALSAEGAAARHLPPDTHAGARALLALLDWPVAQLITLAMALVGNFDTVLGAWKDAGGAALRLDTAFLRAAARASVRREMADEAQDYIDEGLAPETAMPLGELPELRDAMSLAWRILLLWLAILALFVIGGWVS